MSIAHLKKHIISYVIGLSESFPGTHSAIVSTVSRVKSAGTLIQCSGPNRAHLRISCVVISSISWVAVRLNAINNENGVSSHSSPPNPDNALDEVKEIEIEYCLPGNIFLIAIGPRAGSKTL